MAWAPCSLFTVNKSAQTITAALHIGSSSFSQAHPSLWSGVSELGGDADGPEPLTPSLGGSGYFTLEMGVAEQKGTQQEVQWGHRRWLLWREA